MTTENAKNDPENRDPTCSDSAQFQSTDQGAEHAPQTSTQAHEASCMVCQIGHAKHCVERALHVEIDDLRAELQELRSNDWLGLLMRQPNFGDNGTHTWADVIADYLGLQGTDDAQGLYLKLVERDGELLGVQRRADAAEREVRRLKLEVGGSMSFAVTQPVTMVRRPRPELTSPPTREGLADRIRSELEHGRLALEHLGESGSSRCTPWAAQQAAVWCPERERRGLWLDVVRLWQMAELQQRVGEQPKWRAVHDEAGQLAHQAVAAAEQHLRAVEGGHG